MAPPLLYSRGVPRGRPYPIAFLLTSFEVGGTERQMVELIRRLDRDEFDVHVACFHRRGALEPLVADQRHLDRDVPASTASAVRRRSGNGWRLPRWCRRINARIVHTCELYANIFGLPGGGAGWRRRARRQSPRACDAGQDARSTRLPAAGVRDGTCRRRELGGGRCAAAPRRRPGAERFDTISNGVDCATFAPAGRPPRPIRRVITVANLRPEKGHDTLIAAAAQVVKARPDTEFLVVGGGPLAAHLRQDVERRGLGSQVQFLGERGDVPALLASSDVFVLPSRSEACPNGVLEAMAAGLPIVASRVGGVPELVESGVPGCWSSPISRRRWRRRCSICSSRPQCASALGLAARERAERLFSFDRMVSRFEHLYRSELGSRAVGPNRAVSSPPPDRRTQAMCGIAGKLGPSAHAPVDRGLIRAMGDAVAHRGPDADGFYVGEGIGLAHRRLSIVDVATGQQPLANEDGTVWVVFNGEIYNFPALRTELESRGHRFRTHSDTEVIVHGYEEWGDACVERFRGMFAFAIWDTRRAPAAARARSRRHQAALLRAAGGRRPGLRRRRSNRFFRTRQSTPRGAPRRSMPT